MDRVDRNSSRVACREDIGCNPSLAQPLGELIAVRLSRRGFVRRLGAVSAAGLLGGTTLARAAMAGDATSTLTFEEVAHGIDPDHHVAEGYAADVLIRWGDGVHPDAPAFDPMKQSAAAQELQFGYNCDFIAYMPLPQGSNDSTHGLLCVNHEYTDAELMFPGLTMEDKLGKLTAEQIAIELAAHGHSVVEIRKDGGKWRTVPDSQFNRRISLASTPMKVSGPAAGSERLRTKADPDGINVVGTLNNCGGGTTPWGTVLICEENFNNYFGAAEAPAESPALARYGVTGESEYAFWRHDERFDLTKEPNEPNRFGWVVEIDPYRPDSVPVKRTALGRFKHEAATTVVNNDGRLVVYLGDDERFEYVYKFVSAGKVDTANRAANADLLDDGTLYVATFAADGKVVWKPLIHGEGPLTAENGFASQADVAIETRRAADLVGATPMDRPEDVETNPATGSVYVILTNNTKRSLDNVDRANPRAENTAGHIIEIVPPKDGTGAPDHASLEGSWDFFLIAGDPLWGSTLYGQGTSADGWLSCPDNCAFDSKGRIWIASDQGSQQGKFGIGDGIWAADTTGDGRAMTRFFYRTPQDAEMCGPCFTPDDKTFFVSVQHPGEQKNSSFDKPSTRWPDFKDGMPPRPSVVAITRQDGGEIGG